MRRTAIRLSSWLKQPWPSEYYCINQVAREATNVEEKLWHMILLFAPTQTLGSFLALCTRASRAHLLIAYTLAHRLERNTCPPSLPEGGCSSACAEMSGSSQVGRSPIREKSHDFVNPLGAKRIPAQALRDFVSSVCEQTQMTNHAPVVIYIGL
eukprot:3584540-Pyramimonas_sp.AAC.2